jgi:hypothetical protein
MDRGTRYYDSTQPWAVSAAQTKPIRGNRVMPSVIMSTPNFSSSENYQLRYRFAGKG